MVGGRRFGFDCVCVGGWHPRAFLQSSSRHAVALPAAAAIDTVLLVHVARTQASSRVSQAHSFLQDVRLGPFECVRFPRGRFVQVHPNQLLPVCAGIAVAARQDVPWFMVVVKVQIAYATHAAILRRTSDFIPMGCKTRTKDGTNFGIKTLGFCHHGSATLHPMWGAARRSPDRDHANTNNIVFCTVGNAVTC